MAGASPPPHTPSLVVRGGIFSELHSQQIDNEKYMFEVEICSLAKKK